MSRKTGKPSRQVARPAPGLSWAQLARLGAGLLVALAIGVWIGLEVAGPSGSEAAVAKLRAEESGRDAAQIVELTAMARKTKTALTPVVAGLAAAQPPSPGQVLAWQQVMKQETERYAVTVSGSTLTNVARGAFRSAVDGLSVALDTYAHALALPEGQRNPLLELASRQRTIAVTTWSVAATQLDQLNVDSGNGHQHVYLSDRPDGGAMTPDGAAEGSKP